jgi:hypothetical protein
MSVLNILVQDKTITTAVPSSEMRYDILYDEGFNLVKDHLLWIIDTLFESDVRIRQPTGNKILIKIDMPMRPPVTPRTISGFILTPLVSSSKNLNNPALEAGRGAFFFLLM